MNKALNFALLLPTYSVFSFDSMQDDSYFQPNNTKFNWTKNNSISPRRLKTSKTDYLSNIGINPSSLTNLEKINTNSNPKNGISNYLSKVKSRLEFDMLPPKSPKTPQNPNRSPAPSTSTALNLDNSDSPNSRISDFFQTETQSSFDLAQQLSNLSLNN